MTDNGTYPWFEIALFVVCCYLAAVLVALWFAFGFGTHPNLPGTVPVHCWVLPCQMVA